MGVRLAGPQIAATLANADRRARINGDELMRSDLARHWLPHIEPLLEPSAPRTYVAVLVTIITARSMFESDILDVRAIQTNYSEKGYSAASIAKQVASFAKEHQIDLRATSSQPMNNQPFTFKAYIDPTWEVYPRGAAAWALFNDLVDEVQDLSSVDAAILLSLLFYRCRREGDSVLDIHLEGGRDLYDEILDRVCDFVDTTASNGRVGQAFVAALLDTVFDPTEVSLGAVHDPDATRPGDVHVGDEVWLWAEVKQKVVETGDVEGFIKKVSEAGGDRIVYFALSNGAYGSNLIKDHSVTTRAARHGVQIKVVRSSREAADWVLSLARGSLARVAENLLARLHARMLEAGCTPEAIAAIESLATKV